jgi:hypothetical protein
MAGVKICSLVVVLAACGAAPHARTGSPARTGYVVTPKDDTPDGRAALGRALGADDPQGDGFVIRLDDAGRARVAAMPAVATVVPLAAAAKLGKLPSAGRVDVRVDLYDDATDADRDAVAAWITAHGGAVASRGAPTPASTIDATIDAGVTSALAAQDAVRWIEPR